MAEYNGKFERFSVEACRNKFAVASGADAKVICAYGAQSGFAPGIACRISCVIDPAGRVVHAFESGNPQADVASTLKVVEALAATGKRRAVSGRA